MKENQGFISLKYPLSTAFSVVFASLNLAEEAEPSLGWQKLWKKCEHQTGSLGRGSLHVMEDFSIIVN